MARYLALTCEALARSVYAAAATSPHTVTIELFRQGLHNTPKLLRHTLQDQIDAVKPGAYDAIILAYGLCGASTAQLIARHTPIVMPRAHDCITLYLGSRDRYQAEFEKHPGTYWYSADYLERQEPGAMVALGATGTADELEQYEAWVEKYGEETADMLREEMRGWMSHYTRAAFIDTGLVEAGQYEQRARDKAESEGWVFERMQGNRRMMDMLIRGEWTPEDYLIVPPGHSIQQTGAETIIKAVPVS